MRQEKVSYTFLAPKTSLYRAKKAGVAKSKSIGGWIVGSDIKTLSLIVIEKGEKEIPDYRLMQIKRLNRWYQKLYGI